MEKVLTNIDLLKKILKYAGINGEERCIVCDRIIKYQLFYQIIKIKGYKKYCNLEACENKYLCDDECLNHYKNRHSNVKCIILLTTTIIISLGIIIIFPIIFNNKNL